MKFVFLLIALVAHVACQGATNHFQTAQNQFGGRSQSRFENTNAGRQATTNQFGQSSRSRINDNRAIENNAQPQSLQFRPRPRPRPTTTTTPKPTTKKPAGGGGRLLSLPEPELCASRPKQWQFGGKNYYFSWDQETEIDPATGKTIQPKVDWLKARNECRRRCMDSIGIESEAENEMVVKFLRDRKLKYVWTSGRLCDFQGCEARTDLHPLNVFGWFWSDTNTKTAATNSTPPGWKEQPWSNTGHTKVPQPDNAEFDINKTPESCLGVLNNIYKDGIKWHDIACYHKKPFICEDSELLLRYVQQTNPGIQL